MRNVLVFGINSSVTVVWWYGPIRCMGAALVVTMEPLESLEQ